MSAPATLHSLPLPTDIPKPSPINTSQVDPAVIADQPSQLLNDISVISHPSPPALTDAPPLSAISNPNPSTHVGRGKKWQPEEDELLCHSWLRVSQDPSLGADQRADTFWNRVADDFLRASPASRRPPRSIQQRWAKLQQSISQFGECFEEQEARLPAGTPTETTLVEALKSYKLKTDHTFSHYSCWTLVRHAPEWTDHLTKPRMLPKRKTLDLSDEGSGNDNSDSGPPAASKKARKEPQDQRAKLSERRISAIEELAQAMKQKILILQEYNRLERETNEIAIMSALKTPESEAWLKMKQQQILTDMIQKQ